jgi:hypothetical protein
MAVGESDPDGRGKPQFGPWLGANLSNRRMMAGGGSKVVKLEFRPLGEIRAILDVDDPDLGNCPNLESNQGDHNEEDDYVEGASEDDSNQFKMAKIKENESSMARAAVTEEIMHANL